MVSGGIGVVVPPAHAAVDVGRRGDDQVEASATGLKHRGAPAGGRREERGRPPKSSEHSHMQKLADGRRPIPDCDSVPASHSR